MASTVGHFHRVFPDPALCITPSHCTCIPRESIRYDSTDFANSLSWIPHKCEDDMTSSVCILQRQCQAIRTYSAFEAPANTSFVIRQDDYPLYDSFDEFMNSAEDNQIKDFQGLFAVNSQNSITETIDLKRYFASSDQAYLFASYLLFFMFIVGITFTPCLLILSPHSLKRLTEFHAGILLSLRSITKSIV